MQELRDIFLCYGPEYLARYGGRMLPSHRRALQDIIACRTELLGGHVVRCESCGIVHYAYHSCSNRSCPACCGKDTERWLKKRRDELLPTPYFHIVFTVPQELRDIMRRHQKVLYGLLARAAAQALMKLAADERYVGGKIALLSVLHTWTRALVFHPHVHFLVAGGALSDDGRSWHPARKNFFVPVRALSLIFRAKFMALARKTLPDVVFPKDVWDKRWVVDIRPRVDNAEKVIEYLARYIHRIAITNNRILSVVDGKVSFRYKDSRDKRSKTMTLPAMEFIRRFLQHVLPRGLHKVRYYGLLSPTHRHLVEDLQQILSSEMREEEKAHDDNSTDEDKPTTPETGLFRCPFCLAGWMVIISRIPRRYRGPP